MDHIEEWIRSRNSAGGGTVESAVSPAPASSSGDRRFTMTKRFKVGDHVTWNSEAGRVSGKIIKVHVHDVDYKGHTHHASADRKSVV
jgi:hypothetical protein